MEVVLGAAGGFKSMVRVRDGRWVAVALAGLLSSCGPQWERVERLKEGFVVDFPGTPVCGPQESETKVFGQLVGYGSCSAQVLPEGLAQGSVAHYKVSWLRLPTDEIAADGGGVVGVVRRLLAETKPTARPQHERSAKLGGRDAIELEWSTSEQMPETGVADSVEYSTRLRYVLVQDRLISVEFEGILTPWHEQTWRKFAASFRLVE